MIINRILFVKNAYTPAFQQTKYKNQINVRFLLQQVINNWPNFHQKMGGFLLNRTFMQTTLFLTKLDKLY